MAGLWRRAVRAETQPVSTSETFLYRPPKVNSLFKWLVRLSRINLSPETVLTVRVTRHDRLIIGEKPLSLMSVPISYLPIGFGKFSYR